MSKDIPVYKIDSNVPVPVEVNKPHIRQVIPIDDLGIGESVEFPLELQSSVAPTASRLKKMGKVFTIKKVSEKTARIWRVE